MAAKVARARARGGAAKADVARFRGPRIRRRAPSSLPTPRLMNQIPKGGKHQPFGGWAMWCRPSEAGRAGRICAAQSPQESAAHAASLEGASQLPAARFVLAVCASLCNSCHRCRGLILLPFLSRASGNRAEQLNQGSVTSGTNRPFARIGLGLEHRNAERRSRESVACTRPPLDVGVFVGHCRPSGQTLRCRSYERTLVGRCLANARWVGFFRGVLRGPQLQGPTSLLRMRHAIFLHVSYRGKGGQALSMAGNLTSPLLIHKVSGKKLSDKAGVEHACRRSGSSGHRRKHGMYRHQFVCRSKQAAERARSDTNAMLGYAVLATPPDKHNISSWCMYLWLSLSQRGRIMHLRIHAVCANKTRLPHPIARSVGARVVVCGYAFTTFRTMFMTAQAYPSPQLIYHPKGGRI